MSTIRSLAITWVIGVAACLYPAIAAAQQTFVPPTQFIVKWHAGISVRDGSPEALASLEDARRLVGISVIYVRTLYDRSEVLRSTTPLTRQQVTNFFTAMRGAPADYVEEDVLFQAAANPGDPRFNEQVALRLIDAPQAWDRSTGTDALVAVLDTGVLAHEDLEGHIVPGYDFISDPLLSNDGDGRDPVSRDEVDPGSGKPDCPQQNWHGTLVAGAIAAVGGNNLGIAGTAFNANLLPIRVLGRCGTGYSSDVAEAILYAVSRPIPGEPENRFPAHVINLSFSGPGACGHALQNAVDSARERGAVIVTAAGNLSSSDPSNPSPSPDAARYAPGNCRDVISVTAVDNRGSRHEVSTYGSTVTLAAPGETLSTGNTGVNEIGDNSYEGFMGTSVSAALTSGVAALVRSHLISLTPDQVTSIVRDTAVPFVPPGRICDGCGAGVLNAALAVAAVDQIDGPPAQAPRTLRANPAALSRPGPNRYRLTWDAVLLATGYEIETSRDGVVVETHTVTGQVFEEYAPTDVGLWRHRVRALKDTLTGPWSGPLEIPYADPTLRPLSAPNNFRADSLLSQGLITLSFDPVPRATSYVLSENGVETTYPADLTVIELIHDSGTYSYILRARNIHGDGPPSNTVVVTVDREPPSRIEEISTDAENGVSPSGAFEYTWEPVNSANYYEYRRALADGTWSGPVRTTSTFKRYQNQPYGDAPAFQARTCKSASGLCSAYTSAPAITVVEPLPPTLNDLANPRSTGTYTVTWNPADGAASSQLRQCRDGIESNCGSPIQVSGLSHQFTGQRDGQYKHQARSFRNGRFGDWSAMGAPVRVCQASCQ